MRVNLFAFAILAVAGLQSVANAQTIQWEPSPTIEKVGYFQDDKPDGPDIAALQETIEKLELRLREVEDDVQDRLEAVPDPKEAAEQADSFETRMSELEKSFEENSEAIAEVEDTLPNLLFHSHGKSEDAILWPDSPRLLGLSKLPRWIDSIGSRWRSTRPLPTSAACGSGSKAI